MDAYSKTSQSSKGWFAKFIVPAAWTLAALLGFILVNWTIHSLVPPEQVEVAAPNTEIPFATQVRQGTVCTGSLAVAHGFSVALTNDDRTVFIPFEQKEPGSELRSFIWSADGKQLAVLGNTRGSGNIYLSDPSGTGLDPVLKNPEVGYLFYFDWSPDGRQFLAWSLDHQDKIFVFKADGTGLIEKPLDVQILDAPRFIFDGSSIAFYGATSSSAGLYKFSLENSETALINSSMQSAGSYAFSRDGTHLAFMEFDRVLGEARLYSEDQATRKRTLLGTFSIPTGSGSSLPDIANLNWSPDGTKLIFEFGRYVQNRAIYIANADGSGMSKVIEAAHAPTISSDGRCLAFIRNKQVFLLDLSSSQFEPLLLADLPAPRGTVDFRLDELRWQP